MQRRFFIIASILGGLTVAISAYGAHAGAKYFTSETIITFGKATRYQMYHTLALFAIIWALSQWTEQKKILIAAGWSFISGIILFSGSLYLIAFFGLRAGYITPLGGTAFVVGWLLMAIAAWRQK